MLNSFQAHNSAIHCDGCAQAIKRSLGRLPGVQNVDVDIAQHDVTVDYDADITTPIAIRERLAQAGFPSEEDTEA